MSDDGLDMVAVVGDLDGDVPGQAAAKIICPSCQEQSHINDSFCQKCGSSLVGGMAIATESRSAEDSRVISEQSAPPKKLRVFVERDYSKGMMTKFETTYPPQLAGKISEAEFKVTVEEINRICEQAEAVGPKEIFQGIIGCITVYLSNFCFTTNYSTRMKILRNYIQSQNDLVYGRLGLVLENPQTSAFRHVSSSVEMISSFVVALARYLLDC